jgi:hypothetical protein
MNRFALVGLDSNDCLKVLFRDTLPKFGLCDSNMMLNGLNIDVRAKEDMLKAKDRTIFEYAMIMNSPGDAVAATMMSHFMRLCLYKTKFARPVIADLKKKWAMKSLALETVNIMIDGQYMPTDQINWTVMFPDPKEFTTSIVEHELAVTGWIWGCSLLHHVCMHTVALMPVVAQDASESVSYDPQEVCYSAEHDTEKEGYMNMLREAASVFNYLTLNGNKEGFAKFDRSNPLFMKAYVCFAYQNMCLALAYVVQANAFLKESLGSNLAGEAVICLQLAYKLIDVGYDALKNGKNGADDTGIFLPYSYNYIRVTIFVYYKFYEARLFAVSEETRKQAYAQMIKVMEFPYLTPANRDTMRNMVKDLGVLNEQMESEGVVSRIFSAIKKTVMFERPAAFETLNAAMYEINKLPALPEVVYDRKKVKEVKVIAADKFVFSFVKFI